MGTDISHHIEYDPASVKTPPRSLHTLKTLQKVTSGIDDASTTTSACTTASVSTMASPTATRTDPLILTNSRSLQSHQSEISGPSVLNDVSPDPRSAKPPANSEEDHKEECDDGVEPQQEEEEGEYMEGPVEYDEACPVYYDLKQETYFYYGNVLYYDPDSECYYYYDWDQEDYLYIDEDTQTMINEDSITYWNEDDGMYHDPASWNAQFEDQVGETEQSPQEAQEIDTADDTAEEKPEEETDQANQIEQVEQANRIEQTDQFEPATEKEGILCSPENVQEELSSEPISDPPAAPTIPRRVLKADVSAPRKSTPEKFNSGIDQFRSSEGALRNRAMDILMSVTEDRSDLLNQFERKPNGTYKIGQNKRQISALIRQTIELKALCATDCSNASASLEHLNLVQLLQIRSNSRNSAWDRSPIHAHKTFAMKTDVMIAEKFLNFLFASDLDMPNPEDASLNSFILRDLPVFERRFIGSSAICVIGALDQLNESRLQILGSKEPCIDSWWYLDSSPLGVVVPRDRVIESPRGIFMKISQYSPTNPKQTRFTAQATWPEGVCTVYKLVEGRICDGSMYWDVLAIPYIEKET